ncbi:MAG: ATP-binding protein [Rudaea sp.]
MNWIEGAHEKTEAGLRTIVLAQANVRLYVAIPVILIDLILFFLEPGGIPSWLLGLTAGYCAYALSPYMVVRSGGFTALRNLLLATAVLDPLVLSVWIAATGEYGSLIIGFYLFTTIGFGFRTGRPLMYLCQGTSIAGFCMVLAYTPYWQQHPVVGIALLIPTIVVPLYADVLIRKLRTARERAEQESRAKSDLLAKVSHELRTPLTGIVASAELLAVESNDASVSRRTETILALSDNLLSEINDLLDEAKFDAKTGALDYTAIDLNKQVTRLQTTFETIAARKGLAFRMEMDSAVADFVEIDPHYLDRILLNLTSNAIKFTDKGSVRMAVELLEQTTTNYRVRFSVTDSGIGIPETFRAKIFESFSQVDEGANRRYGGTGLGLSLSKKIIDLMGGELQFESTLGKGSRFWFELLLRRTAPTVASVAEEDITNIVCGKRILVADDNVSNLMLLKEMLEIDQHEVTTSASGMETLEILVKHDFDLLLLDYNLGDMDGVRVLQTYRFGRLNPMPVLFLTADATIQTATRLQQAGGAGILYKPIGLANVRRALARLDLSPASRVPESDGPAPVEQARPARPALMVVPANPLNEDVIHELRKINARPDFLRRLLSQAENDIVRCCQQLLEALASRNYAQIRTAAHALKGVSANVGAVRLVALASTLMNMPSEELDSSCERLAADIRDSSRSTGIAIAKIIADDQTSADDAGSLQLD